MIITNTVIIVVFADITNHTHKTYKYYSVLFLCKEVSKAIKGREVAASSLTRGLGQFMLYFKGRGHYGAAISDASPCHLAIFKNPSP